MAASARSSRRLSKPCRQPICSWSLPGKSRRQSAVSAWPLFASRTSCAASGIAIPRSGRDADEDRWLGWLTLPMQDRDDGIAPVVQFANEIKAEGTTDVVLLGMGGSSLAPEVMRLDHRPRRRLSGPSRRRFHRSRADPLGGARDRFSPDDLPGGVEVGDDARGEHPQAAFFPSRGAGARRGRGGAPLRVDDRPWLEARAGCASRKAFARFFRDCRPSVAGIPRSRTSGWCPPRCWGPIPCCCSIARARWPSAARRPVRRIPASSSAWCWASWRCAGRDKPTLIAPPGVASFGAWLEQLVAESLGKHGKGIIPIEGEVAGRSRGLRERSRLRPRAICRARRMRPQTRRSSGSSAPAILSCASSGPIRYALGAEFYRWEFATAVAGAVLGVNPFDQPDVEAAKIVTRRLAGEYEQTGTLVG